MLETILTLYTTAMVEDVRSPMPHIFGPPGSGKSTAIEQAADMLGVTLHTLNVSRISPLELEGVQMPTEGKLELLLSTYWNKLKHGDILLLDEFLRGFPEVYNGLLDIFTSRTVAGHKLPKVFIIAASNSVDAYDSALADRLLHIPVDNPGTHMREYKRITQTIVSALGLMPQMLDNKFMVNLMTQVVLPTYLMMDQMKASASGAPVSSQNATAGVTGLSPRNLIGQAKLRFVTCPELSDLLRENNSYALISDAPEFYQVHFFNKGLVGTRDFSLEEYESRLATPDKYTPAQLRTLKLNHQLVKAHTARTIKKEDEPDDNLFE